MSNANKKDLEISSPNNDDLAAFTKKKENQQLRSGNTVRTTVDLESLMHSAIKMAATRERKSISAFIREIVAAHPGVQHYYELELEQERATKENEE